MKPYTEAMICVQNAMKSIVLPSSRYLTENKWHDCTPQNMDGISVSSLTFLEIQLNA
jgi:hypothetical protein